MRKPNQNKIGEWLSRITRLSLLMLFFCISTGVLHANDDYEVIAERVIKYNKSTMTTAALDTRVTNALALYEEGSVALGSYYGNRTVNGAHFNSLNYSSRDQSGWELYLHPTYMQYMADAYTRPDSKYYKDVELFEKIEKLLKFWTEANVSSTNWWQQSIGVPKPMTLALLYIKYGSSDKHIDVALEDAELARIKSTSYTAESQTGPNKSDIATHFLYRALIKKEANTLKNAVEQAFDPLKLVNTSQEGIQYDYSYFQHSKQLQIASYGAELINTTVSFLEFFVDTQFAVGKDKLEIFSKFVRETYFGTMRGQYVPYMLTGRGVTRSGSTNRSGNARYAKSLILTDPAHSAEYELIAKKLEKTAHASEGITASSKLYHIGDYIYHNRPGYQYSIRTVSSRTLRSEWGNEEGWETYFMSDGGSTILQDGDEYENIYGVWDWSKVPGVTNPLIPRGHIPNSSGSMGNGPYGTHAFVGGVSDNVYSAYVYTQNDKWGANNRQGKRVNINTVANKSWFMFDKEVIAVGSGLTSTATHADLGDLELITTVNQALLKGNILVGLKDGTVETLGLATSKEYSNVKWVVHNNIGYVFPSDGLVKVEAANKSGAWNDINGTQSSTIYSRDLFALWLSHGKKAQNEKYSYLVVPNISNAAEMQTYCDNDLKDIEIIVNDNSTQVVRHKSLGIWQIIFRKAGLFEHEELKIKADQPCAVMIKDINIEEKTATMYVGDVMQYGNVLAFGIDIPGFTDKLKAVYVDNASSGVEKGKSIKVQLDRNLTDYIEIEEPEEPVELSFEYQSVLTADTYANQAKPTTTHGTLTEMVVKYDGGSMKRVGYIKAPLDDLDKIDNLDNYNLEISIDLCFMWANAGMPTGVAWTLHPVTGNDWDENSLTFENKPAWSDEIVGQTPASVLSSGSIVSIDISEYAIKEYKAGKRELSLVVYNSISGSKVDAGFRTRENANEALKPKITVKGYKRDDTVLEYQSLLIADTYANQAAATTTHGTSTEMVVKNDPGTKNREGFIKAPLTDLDKIDNIDNYDINVSIDLCFMWAGIDIAKTTWTLHPVTGGDWDEYTLTYNNKPAWSNEIVGQVPGSSPGSGSVVSIDISEYAIKEYKAGKKELSLVVYNGTPGASVDAGFRTRENVNDALKPKITVKARKHGNRAPLETKTSNVIHDAYVKNGNGADINYGNDADLQVNTGGAGWHREAYLMFSLDELKKIDMNRYDVEVFMSLYQHNSQTEADKSPWNVRWVPNNNWTESLITWNNKPGAIDKVIASQPGFVKGTENGFQDKYIVMFDITQYALAQIAAHAENISFNVKGSADAGNSSKYVSFFASKEYKLNGVDVDERTVPKLVIKLYEKKVITIPASSTWFPQAGSTDWSLFSNWSDGVPGTITKVTIPKSDSYPVLTEETVVSDIYIEAGAELGRQDLLIHNKAFVDYDFGKGNRSIHFRMLSIPLMEAFPGDFTFGGQPDSYIQTLQADESGRGKWIALSGGNSAALSAGTGFALSLDPDKDADKGLGLSGGILRLPFFDSESNVEPDVHPNHSYNEWTSTFSNPYGAGSYDITRSANAYRLAGANVSVNPSFGQSGSNVIALVGNPFMTTIDFNQLQADNSDLIKDNYQVWTKVGSQEGYAGYSPDGNWGLIMEPEMDNLISPLQSFVVERNGEATGSVDFNLLNITSSKSGMLRKSTASGNKIDIVAKNDKASVRTFIAKREGGTVEFSERDARKLINNLTDVPEIYTLKSFDKGMVAVGANIYNGEDVEYPIGLATSYNGEITLTFSGMDNCDSRVIFTDNVMKKTIELTGLSKYDYTFSYAPETKGGQVSALDNRFSLRMVSSTSGIEDEWYDTQNLAVYPENGFICAVSNEYPISGIKVYNLNGIMLYNKSKINAMSYKTTTGFGQGVYIVEVKTGKGVMRKKIIINNL